LLPLLEDDGFVLWEALFLSQGCSCGFLRLCLKLALLQEGWRCVSLGHCRCLELWLKRLEFLLESIFVHLELSDLGIESGDDFLIVVSSAELRLTLNLSEGVKQAYDVRLREFTVCGHRLVPMGLHHHACGLHLRPHQECQLLSLAFTLLFQPLIPLLHFSNSLPQEGEFPL